MPKEMQDFWPSLLPNEHEPQAEALSPEDFEFYINDMTEFMHLVLKIGFNFLHLYQHNSYAKSRYDELFKKDVG